MSSQDQFKVIFYHVGSKQFYYGPVTDYDGQKNLYVVKYSGFTRGAIMTTHVHPNNAISLELNDHPKICTDTVA